MTGLLHSAAIAAAVARGVRARGLQHEIALDQGWEFARVPPGAAATPSELGAAAAQFGPAIVPGTVAMADPEASAALDLDAWDHWYRCGFAAPAQERARVLLCLDGLASLADVFLNGRLLAQSSDMFLSHALDVSGLLAPHNELWIRFRALAPVLRERKPRGRWPTRLVTERNLRFVRTTLLGYMPGFCPTVRPVGPYRGVRLLVQRELTLDQLRLRAGIDAGRGVLEIAASCRVLDGGTAPDRAELVAGAARAALAVAQRGDEYLLQGRLVIDELQRWWPHTHGKPFTYEASLHLHAPDGRSTAEFELGRIGFRSLERLDGDGFGLRINGERVFCRGAAWTPLDVRALHARGDDYRAALEQVRSAGMNMLRLSGTMVYESDAFYRLCDELGILVWQDFMFANMDYPADDPEFLALCRCEADQLLQRLSARACLAVLCGNSEASQQAAMMGVELSAAGNALFDRVLPELCAEHRPDVPYVHSTPSAGTVPFRSGPGPSHYYGVGAYLRPLDDARLRPIRFAAECLAFAMPPEDESLRAQFGDDPVVAHDPRYKAGVPRDRGAGWDFADVTDHYVEALFGVSARQLRYADPERYLALCRIAPGEAMAAVQGFWRRRESPCNGALIWMLRDLRQGAGLGLIDSQGTPKAAYYYLRRAWAPLAVWLVDAGTDGLSVHAANDRPEPLAAVLEIALYRRDGAVVERVERAIELAAHDEQAFDVEVLIGRFVDASYAYRFGPPAHAVVAARLLSRADGGPRRVLARAFHLPCGLSHGPDDDVGLVATARPLGDGSYLLTATARRFAQSVHVEAAGYRPDDDYFHLAPGDCHEVLLRPRPGAGPLRGRLRALNTVKTSSITLEANTMGERP